MFAEIFVNNVKSFMKNCNFRCGSFFAAPYISSVANKHFRQQTNQYLITISSSSSKPSSSNSDAINIVVAVVFCCCLE